jgi:hypothetical protein
MRATGEKAMARATYAYTGYGGNGTRCHNKRTSHLLIFRWSKYPFTFPEKSLE